MLWAHRRPTASTRVRCHGDSGPELGGHAPGRAATATLTVSRPSSSPNSSKLFTVRAETDQEVFRLHTSGCCQGDPAAHPRHGRAFMKPGLPGEWSGSRRDDDPSALRPWAVRRCTAVGCFTVAMEPLHRSGREGSAATRPSCLARRSACPSGGSCSSRDTTLGRPRRCRGRGACVARCCFRR